MNIALDYDETYTCDSELWQQFIYSAQARNHKVYIVTYRYSDNPITETIDCDGIFYTNHRHKSEYMHHKDITIDVWIDDKPYRI